MRPYFPASVAALFLIGAADAASAETIRFTGSLELGCTLTVQDGELAPSPDYTTLSTEEIGGRPAELGVFPVGGPVQIRFSPPMLTTIQPTYGAVAEIKWRTQSGFVRGYNDLDPLSYASSANEVYEVDVRAITPSGFLAGDYEISTIATCSR